MNLTIKDIQRARRLQAQDIKRMGVSRTIPLSHNTKLQKAMEDFERSVEQAEKNGKKYTLI